MTYFEGESYLGKRFGRLEIIEHITQRVVITKCDCGQIRNNNMSFLERGKVTSCGCRNSQFHNAIGMRFGMLVVKERLSTAKCRMVSCLCDCGKEHKVAWNSLRAGHTKSCGCYRVEFLSAGTRTTHGMSKGRTYRIWRHMRNRCHLKTHPRYDEWGGRGITVCERWHTFVNFYEDMGEAKDVMSIDRIDNNLGYYKENCRYADKYTQAQNKSNPDGTGVILKGKKYLIRFQLFDKKYCASMSFDSKEGAIAHRKSWMDEVKAQHLYL